MRRKDREVTDPAEKEAILESCLSAHLALLDGDAPYGVTLNFGWEKSPSGSGYTVWFHCATEGRKIDALKRNPSVWFFAEREGDFRERTNAAGQVYMTMGYASVAGAGRVEFVEDLETKRHGLDLICRRFTATPVSVIPDATIAHTAVFKVELPSLTAKCH